MITSLFGAPTFLTDISSKNKTTFFKAEDESIEEDLESKKRGFFFVIKKGKNKYLNEQEDGERILRSSISPYSPFGHRGLCKLAHYFGFTFSNYFGSLSEVTELVFHYLRNRIFYPYTHLHISFS
jgi:hypothetical protein